MIALTLEDLAFLRDRLIALGDAKNDCICTLCHEVTFDGWCACDYDD